MKRDLQISEELELMFAKMSRVWPNLVRLAVALYDKDTDLLHTFIKAPADSSLMNHFREKLSDIPTLKKLADERHDRVVPHLMQQAGWSPRSDALLEAGFKSSFTVPLYWGDELLGFVFFDADKDEFFDDEVLTHLTTYVHLIEALLVMDILPVKTLTGMVNATKHLTGFKDAETGRHIQRVSAYVELIARELAPSMGLSDEYINYLWLYAPLHDIGKVGVSDKVLLKPTALTSDELKEMRNHVPAGLAIIEQIVADFDFEHFHHLDYLRNIIGCHHEWWDGSGYPNGLKGEEIPLEGRIMALADVFDALSSRRVYRHGYNLEDTFNYIENNSGIHFDPLCVEALLKNKDKALKIYEGFKESLI